MTSIELRQVDTWFFRDATPFTAGATPQEGVSGVFPPHPPTVVGALRAAIARSQGWSGAGAWNEDLHPVLGDGPDDLGALDFAGPIMLRDREPLFPCPRHLVGSTDGDGWEPRAFLRPGSPVRCDLGDAVRLPQIAGDSRDGEALKPPTDIWVTVAGMERVLRGERPSPEQIVRTSRLWTDEPRIGLERAPDTRTAEEGMLYSTRHVRLRPGVSLGVHVTGIPDGWAPTGLVPLGGESRMAECTSRNGDETILPWRSTLGCSGRLVAIAVTPLDLDPEETRPGASIAGAAGARLVSACLGRPIGIGGWDSLARQPLPLRSVLPPGSVLFFETGRGAGLPSAASDWKQAAGGLYRLGSRTKWGFGLVALGDWPPKQETNQ